MLSPPQQLQPDIDLNQILGHIQYVPFSKQGRVDCRILRKFVENQRFYGSDINLTLCLTGLRRRADFLKFGFLWGMSVHVLSFFRWNKTFI